jgi:hypothetical protein
MWAGRRGRFNSVRGGFILLVSHCALLSGALVSAVPVLLAPVRRASNQVFVFFFRPRPLR